MRHMLRRSLFLTCSLLIMCFMLAACSSDVAHVEFELIGENIITINVNEEYIEPGYIAQVDGNPVEIDIQTNLSPSIPGLYPVDYSFSTMDQEYRLHRFVYVKGTLSKYFYQCPPALTPLPFAESFISNTDSSEFAGTFSPDYRYYFFTRRNSANDNRLFYSEYINDEWTEPKLSPISENVSEFEPHISPDGVSLYFGSRRELHTSLVIYRSLFIDGDWTTPEFVGNGLNDGFAMYISEAENHNIYFTSEQGISVMKYNNGEYSSPQFTGIVGAHSFINPDESFMVLDDSGQGLDDTSLYISVYKDGAWLEPIPLNSTINHDGSNECCASISPDGEYLFFARFTDGMADIYWVSIHILDDYLL